MKLWHTHAHLLWELQPTHTHTLLHSFTLKSQAQELWVNLTLPFRTGFKAIIIPKHVGGMRTGQTWMDKAVGGWWLSAMPPHRILQVFVFESRSPDWNVRYRREERQWLWQMDLRAAIKLDGISGCGLFLWWVSSQPVLRTVCNETTHKGPGLIYWPQGSSPPCTGQEHAAVCELQ